MRVQKVLSLLEMTESAYRAILSQTMTTTWCAMYKVKFLREKISVTWEDLGSYNSELMALNAAKAVVKEYHGVKVEDPDGVCIWSA